MDTDIDILVVNKTTGEAWYLHEVEFRAYLNKNQILTQYQIRKNSRADTLNPIRRIQKSTEYDFQHNHIPLKFFLPSYHIIREKKSS